MAVDVAPVLMILLSLLGFLFLVFSGAAAQAKAQLNHKTCAVVAAAVAAVVAAAVAAAVVAAVVVVVVAVAVAAAGATTTGERSTLASMRKLAPGMRVVVVDLLL